jgi:integrase
MAETKTSTGRRRAELDPSVVTTLRAHRTRQLQERLVAGARWVERDLVFPNIYGGPLMHQNLREDSFVPLMRDAGVPRIRFHDLRHTAATLLLLEGVNPKIVSEMLGHASVAITLDLYSHVLPTMQRRAAQTLARLLTHQE